MAFACQQVDYLDQMKKKKNFKDHLSRMQSRLNARCEIMMERNGGEYTESLHIDFQRSDRTLTRGLINRSFVANYICDGNNGEFLQKITGNVMIYFTPGQPNTACEGVVLKEVYKVIIKK